MITSKPRTAVVKVELTDGPATVHARGGRQREEMHLDPLALEAMGSDRLGYFEAERIAGHWWLGQRLTDTADRNW